MANAKTSPPILWLPLVALLLAVALANCVPAFVFPLELEQREGGSWLYVLAAKAGISIYDHQQVAFLNMNHGPLDPLLKSFIATVCPFLSPAMVTRFFVLLLPFGLVAALITVSRSHKLAGVAWGLGLYLFLLGLQACSFLVGRSDPTALFLLAILVMVAAGPLRHALATARRPLPWIGTAGIVAMMVVLTNWRFAPPVGVVLAGFGLEYWDARPSGRGGRFAGIYVGGLILSGAGLFLVILCTVFHGDAVLYYRHFFGFFTAASGWGALRNGDFELLPASLVAAHWTTHLLAAGFVGLGLAFPSEQVSRKLQVRAWIPLLVLLWLSCCVAYYLNRSGGGIWYFAGFYVLLAVHLARAINWQKISVPAVRVALALALAASLPWQADWRQATLLQNSFQPAYAFLHAAHSLAEGESIHSENYYFYKDRYEGEVVDMGDVVYQVSGTGYYGKAMAETADRYFVRLQTDPPKFIIAGECSSPLLIDQLRRLYRPVLLISPVTTRYIGPAQTFYRLKPVAAAKP